MSGDHTSEIPARGRLGRTVTVLICAVILLSGVGVTMFIFSTEPTATRIEATRKSAMLVDVTKGEKGDFCPTIVAMGTVRPSRDILLSPRVSGEVVQRSAAFTPGSLVSKGDLLLLVDPADYRNIVRQKESRLEQAIADLKIEMGRQNIARQEYDLLQEEELSPENKALVLRQPQLNTARAEVEAARAEVDQARLDLQRTEITAPFDAQILSRNVDIGSQVAPGDTLGRLVGLHDYWVEATVPLAVLPRLSLPDGPEERGAEVQVRNRTAWPEGIYRQGNLYKVIGELEGQTRLARVLVSVTDPLARRSASAGLPALMLGSFLETRIKAREIKDVIRLSRDYIRSDDTVWVMEGGELAIRKVAVVFRDAEYAYIRKGLEADDLVVTTNLTTVVAGAGLRLKEAGGGNASREKHSPEGGTE